MKIYKYKLGQSKLNVITMPSGPYDLTVQLQGDSIFLWSMIDESQETIERIFEIVGTGDEFDPTDKYYLGTVQQGLYVWHVFEKLSEPFITKL